MRPLANINSENTRNIQVALVSLITGDGIGPEIADAAKRCVDATGADIQWDIVEAGSAVMEKCGSPLPQETIDSVVRNKVALKAPVTTPVGTGFRSINVHLRQTLDLYACVRPCKSRKGIDSRYDDVDIVVVRENTEGLYAGVEFKEGEKETAELIDWLNAHNSKQIAKDSGISIKPISIKGTERIVRYAFEYAKKNNRKKVTSVHKANIMKFSDGLWLEVSRRVAKDYPEIEFDDLIVDNMCQQLVMDPSRYDILVMPNLYGDIVSDLCAGLIGGPGVAQGANIGEKGAVFEATHGSAPTIAGQNIANPIALIFSAVMMLEHLEMRKEAAKLEEACNLVLAEGKSLTPDLAKDSESATGTKEMADAIIEKIKSL